MINVIVGISLFIPIKNKILKLLPANQFVKNVGLLASSTIGSRFLVVIVAPILTRLYTPADFGLLAVYTGLLSVITIVACLRYELAIPIPDNNDDAMHLVALCLLSITITTIIISLLLAFFGIELANIFGIPLLVDFYWLLILGVVFSGIFSTFTYWAIRNKEFFAIATSTFRQTIVTIFIQLFGFKGGGVTLLLGTTAGRIASTFTLGKKSFSDPNSKKLSWENIKYVASKYNKYPIFESWSGLLNTIGQQLAALMLAAFFSPVMAGLYLLAHRVIWLPLSSVGGAIAKVFYSTAVDSVREEELDKLVVNTHDALAHISMPLILILIFVGPNLFILIFGEQWEKAGEIARLMSPMIYFQFITSPITTLVPILGKHEQGIAFQAALLITRACSIIIGFWMGEVITAIALYSLGSSICYLFLLMWIFRQVGKNVSRVIYSTVSSLIISLICTSPLLVFSIYEGIESSMIISLVITSIFIAIRYSYLLRRAY